MGRDKALLPYKGRPLVEHAVCLLKDTNLAPHIVGSGLDLAPYAPVIPDLHEGRGPLGGIEAALAESNSDWNMFVPVDLPLLSPAFLRYLRQRVNITGAYATIPMMNGRPMPLCAVYHRNLLSGIRDALESGTYKVLRAIEKAAGSSMDIFSVEAVVSARDDLFPVLSIKKNNRMGRPECVLPHRWFQNVNTPSDLALIS
jgi:molybdopterin-guanine dinucleotide biosynthesis protein A